MHARFNGKGIGCSLNKIFIQFSIEIVKTTIEDSERAEQAREMSSLFQAEHVEQVIVVVSSQIIDDCVQFFDLDNKGKRNEHFPIRNHIIITHCLSSLN